MNRDILEQLKVLKEIDVIESYKTVLNKNSINIYLTTHKENYFDSNKITINLKKEIQ